jgi:hypothetical protein
VLFKAAQAEAIARGELTCTIRKWKRSQAVAGNTYRTPRGHIRVTSLDVMPLRDVGPADLRAAGFASVDELSTFGVVANDEVHVVRFEVAPAPEVVDPGEDGDLSGDDVAEINGRLDRMDAGRPRPWTRAVLRSLAESPGTRSAELSEQLGIEQARLKSDIRRLKRLGLTRSLERGYELSPRGQAYLDR